MATHTQPTTLRALYHSTKMECAVSPPFSPTQSTMHSSQEYSACPECGSMAMPIVGWPIRARCEAAIGESVFPLERGDARVGHQNTRKLTEERTCEQTLAN